MSDQSPYHLPEHFRTEEANTFLVAYERAANARHLQYQTFRDLFLGLGPHTTILGHINRLLDSLLPNRIGIPDQSGERLKLLFADKPGFGLVPTDLAKMLYERLQPLSKYFSDLIESAVTEASGRKQNEIVLRIGAPHTITLKILSYACSNLTEVFKPEQIRLDISTGDTERDLLPRLELGLLDCVVGYGLGAPNWASVYTDPDLTNVNFKELENSFRMVLIYHPLDKPTFFSIPTNDASEKKKRGWKNRTTPKIDASQLNLRACRSLIAVHSWRQCEGVQDLIDNARRLGRFTEVQTDDEALALVRAGCGIAVVPEVFQRRRVIKSFLLEPEPQFTRRLGVYYSNELGLSPRACKFVEFLRYYMNEYNDTRVHATEAGEAHVPPAYDSAENPTFPKKIIEKMPTVSSWQEFSDDNYKRKIIRNEPSPAQ